MEPGAGVVSRQEDEGFRQEGDRVWLIPGKENSITLSVESAEQPKLTDIKFNVSGASASIQLFYVGKDGQKLSTVPFFVSDYMVSKYSRHFYFPFYPNMPYMDL